jgi:hypothetical protein
MRRALSLFAVLAVAVLVIPASAQAQEATGSITGEVVLIDSDVPLVARVEVYDDTGAFVAEAQAIGRLFTVAGLTPGTYKVKVANRWYSSASTFEEADPVVVNAGVDTAGIKINFSAVEFAFVAGRAYDAVTGEGACVTVNGAARTSGDGSYEIALSPGAWKVSFIDNCDFKYVDQWWNGKPDEASADVIELSAGETVAGIDAAMAMPEDLGGWVSGVVIDSASAEPVPGICVIPYVAPGERITPVPPASHQPTGADGSYRIGHLGDNDVRLEFVDCTGFEYGTRWWPNGTSFETAGTLSVSTGAEITGIDMSLASEAEAPTDTTTTTAATELPFTGTSQTTIWLGVGGLFLLGGLAAVATSRAQRWH